MRRRLFFHTCLPTLLLERVMRGSTLELETALPVRPGLSSAQQERAARVHRESIVFDLHDHMSRPEDSQDMKKGGVTAKIYKPLAEGLYWDDSNRRTFPSDPFDWRGKYLSFVARVEELEKTAQPPVLIVRRLEDLSIAKREGKAGVIIGNEGSLPMGDNAKNLNTLYRRGLRETAFYWPAGEHTRHVLDENGTLTRFGHEIIERGNELGVVLDTAHLSGTPAFWEVLKESKKPVLHTHGAAKFPRTRYFAEGDLQDKEIRTLADAGGVIGLHFCTYIKNLNGWNRSLTIDDLMDHLGYLVKVGGMDCVAIGADYFPYNRNPLEEPFMHIAKGRIEDMDWSKTFVVGLDNISAMPVFTQALVSRGFADGDIKKILGENALRVLKLAWKG